MSHEPGISQDLEDDGPESTIITRNSAAPSRGEVEGFSEDFSQMLRAHFREKLKLKKAIVNGHVVTFSFVLSVATPLSADRLVELEAKAAKKKNQGGIQGPADPSTAVSHMHIEYSILPGDSPLKTDVVFYATAARIFPDRHEPKTVRTWWADGQLWCSWTHSHSVHVTDSLVRRLANHAIELRIWDSREKLSQRARLDRPRGFRASEIEGAAPTGIGISMTSLLGVAGGIVVTQAKLYSQEQSRQVLFSRPFPQTIRKHAISVQHRSEGATSYGGTAGRAGSPTPTESKGSEVQGAKVVPEIGHQLRDYSQLARTANASADFEELARRKRLIVAYKHGQAANNAYLKQGTNHGDSTSSSISGGKNGSFGNIGSKRARPSQADISNTDGGSNLKAMGADVKGSLTSLAAAAPAAAHNLPASSSVVQIVRLRMATLYDGRKSTTCRISQPTGLLADCMMTLIVDPSLLSEIQMHKFKPVLLRLVSAGPLPPGYVASHSVYCRCILPDLSPTPTAAIQANSSSNAASSAVTRAMDELLNKEKQSQQQQSEIDFMSVTESVQPFSNSSAYWNHSIALLTGDIPDDALRTNLLQRPFVVELHDREAAQNQQSSANNQQSTANNLLMKPAVFGTLPNDSAIASTAVLPPPPPEPPKPPYGLSEFSLSDLLVSPTGKGITFSEGMSIVKPTRQPENSTSVSSAVKKIPLPRYLECGTVIKITARAPIPLFTPVKPPARPEPEQPVINSARQSKALSAAASAKSIPITPPEVTLQPSQCIATLVALIPSSLISSENYDRRLDAILPEIIRRQAIDCNSESLALTALVEPEERASALMAYQLAPVQQIDKTLNLITGFQLNDEDGVLLIVEGFVDVISEMWESLLSAVRKFEEANSKTNGKVTIFYNSSLSSPVRRYGGLDLSFGTLSLGRGLSKIVAEPLLYVRDMAPAHCRAAAVKLADLRSTATSLADIFRRDLLPSTAELRSLADEFAMKSPVLPSADRREATLMPDEFAVELEATDQNQAPNEEADRPPRDFLRENAEEVWHLSEKNRLRRETTETISIAVNTGHVYSSHSVNAVEIAKAHIREEMLLPNRRYTFSQNYLHRTMTPRAPSPEQFSLYPHAHRWQFPGYISAIHANKPERLPDTARREELVHPWRENWLHEKYLQPPLQERDPMPWELRKVDLNLYESPDSYKFPQSVFGPGDAVELPLACLPPRRDKRLPVWRRGVRSELIDASSKLSVIDRVADILHDPPNKISLRYHSVRDIPKVSMFIDDTYISNEKCRPFGPLAYNDWLLNRNIVPLKSK